MTPIDADNPRKLTHPTDPTHQTKSMLKTQGSRIEAFSDAVFGFTITLLVVSSAVPVSYADLRQTIAGFPAFAVTFAMICWIWYEHYLFFRRYPLEDGVTIALNALLLFVVVFYTYPLKFVFTRLGGNLFGTGPGIQAGMQGNDGQMLMVVYSTGFVALFSVLSLLHWHALRQREALALTAMDIYDAHANVTRHLINVGLGITSIAITLLLPHMNAFAGLIYFLIGPLQGAYGYYNGRRRERLEAAS